MSEEVDPDQIVMQLMCSKGCGEAISVTKGMIDEAQRKGMPVDVQHEVCPNEDIAPDRNFRTVIEVWEDFDDKESEKLASFGGKASAKSFKTSLPALSEQMSEGWAKVMSIAHMVDSDIEVAPNHPQEVPSDQQG